MIYLNSKILTKGECTLENNNIALVREKVTANMADNLVMLRTKLGLTQVQLANLICVSRHTIMQVENKKAKLSWNTF